LYLNFRRWTRNDWLAVRSLVLPAKVFIDRLRLDQRRWRLDWILGAVR
jgi:hypothetical protein